MKILSPKNNLKYIIPMMAILFWGSVIFAEENRGVMQSQSISEHKKDTVIFGNRSKLTNEMGGPVGEDENSLTEMQKQARMYRAQGIELQRVENLDAAMTFYQKASEIDPSYAVAYNDMGIIYEARGSTGLAEENYLKALTVDPNFLSAYTNLALLYENLRNFDKAAYYWQKRAEMGVPTDPWTVKAQKRVKDIKLILSDRPLEEEREQEVLSLVNDTAVEKSMLRKDNATLAKYYFDKAKLNYQKGNQVLALKMAVDASQLDPTNTDIIEFIDKIQTRLLSK